MTSGSSQGEILHEGLVLAVVGSCCLEGEIEAYRTIQTWLEKLKPRRVISGGAVGIDTMTIEVCEMLGIPWSEELPKTRRWADGFMPRNLRIAERCHGLVRIASRRSKTYGSGWTKDRAQEMGKTTWETILA